jgi:hypothetical protein
MSYLCVFFSFFSDSSWNCPVLVNGCLHVAAIQPADPFLSVVIDPDTGIVLGSSPYYLLNRSPTITILSSIASYSIGIPVFVLPLYEDINKQLRVLFIGSPTSPRILRQSTVLTTTTTTTTTTSLLL